MARTRTPEFQLLIRPELHAQLRALQHASRTRPGGLRHRELEALRMGLRALIEGREHEYDGERLGYSPNTIDLRDCAEIKLPVVSETRYGTDLGPSHRLIYREFEAGPGTKPVREAIAFEHRRSGRPFVVAAQRLNRMAGVRDADLHSLHNTRPSTGPRKRTWRPIAPPRLPLPPELRDAVNAASNPTPARGAVASTPQAPDATTVRKRARAGPGRQR